MYLNMYRIFQTDMYCIFYSNRYRTLYRTITAFCTLIYTALRQYCLFKKIRSTFIFLTFLLIYLVQYRIFVCRSSRYNYLDHLAQRAKNLDKKWPNSQKCKSAQHGKPFLNQTYSLQPCVVKTQILNLRIQIPFMILSVILTLD